MSLTVLLLMMMVVMMVVMVMMVDDDNDDDNGDDDDGDDDGGCGEDIDLFQILTLLCKDHAKDCNVTFRMHVKRQSLTSLYRY